MLIKNKQKLNKLITDLGGFIRKKKTELFALNRKITLDTDYWIMDDYKTVKSYLDDYMRNHYSTKLVNRIKPKGKILIILSYNEPFILSIIPVLNALILGNEVVLKPSREAESFTRMIWSESGFVEKYGLNLKIVSSKTHSDIADLIKNVRAVYFFGSYKVAQIISKICGEYYVEFYPEIETADSKIFNKDKSSIKNDAILTLQESFSHSGQTCQRIQGVFVQKKFYNEYVRTLKQEFIKLCQAKSLNKFVDNKYALARESMVNMLLIDAGKSKPDEIVKIKSLPLLVINPKKNSDFIKNAYFLPVLWISSFNSKENLIKILNLRKFLLGLNIQSDDNDFVKYIVSNTRFTRYTVNTTHTNIRLQEGWGGSWPSGFSGYKSWIEHFSDGYVIINKSQ
ncbi:MAG: aldehyde dehydrogenase family protein [Patescibacteria group bacterium]|nr:aldehyde dehydrogenase family protein [Patescibacteria group bacterium]